MAKKLTIDIETRVTRTREARAEIEKALSSVKADLKIRVDPKDADDKFAHLNSLVKGAEQAVVNYRKEIKATESAFVRAAARGGDHYTANMLQVDEMKARRKQAAAFMKETKALYDQVFLETYGKAIDLVVDTGTAKTAVEELRARIYTLREAGANAFSANVFRGKITGDLERQLNEVQSLADSLKESISRATDGTDLSGPKADLAELVAKAEELRRILAIDTVRDFYRNSGLHIGNDFGAIPVRHGGQGSDIDRAQRASILAHIIRPIFEKNDIYKRLEEQNAETAEYSKKLLTYWQKRGEVVEPGGDWGMMQDLLGPLAGGTPGAQPWQPFFAQMGEEWQRHQDEMADADRKRNGLPPADSAAEGYRNLRAQSRDIALHFGGGNRTVVDESTGKEVEDESEARKESTKTIRNWTRIVQAGLGSVLMTDYALRKLGNNSKIVSTYYAAYGKIFGAIIDTALVPFLPALRTVLSAMTGILKMLRDTHGALGVFLRGLTLFAFTGLPLAMVGLTAKGMAPLLLQKLVTATLGKRAADFLFQNTTRGQLAGIQATLGSILTATVGGNVAEAAQTGAMVGVGGGAASSAALGPIGWLIAALTGGSYLADTASKGAAEVWQKKSAAGKRADPIGASMFVQRADPTSFLGKNARLWDAVSGLFGGEVKTETQFNNAIKPTHFAQGGSVTQTGLALIHTGETVVPAGRQPLAGAAGSNVGAVAGAAAAITKDAAAYTSAGQAADQYSLKTLRVISILKMLSVWLFRSEALLVSLSRPWIIPIGIMMLGIASGIGSLVPWLTGIWTDLTTWITKHGGAAWKVIVTATAEVVKEGWEKVNEAWNWITGFASSAISVAWSVAVTAAATVAKVGWEIANEAWQWFSSFVSRAVSVAWTAAVTATATVVKVGTEVVAEARNWFNGIVAQAKTVAWNAIVNAKATVEKVGFGEPQAVWSGLVAFCATNISLAWAVAIAGALAVNGINIGELNGAWLALQNFIGQHGSLPWTVAVIGSLSVTGLGIAPLTAAWVKILEFVAVNGRHPWNVIVNMVLSWAQEPLAAITSFCDSMLDMAQWVKNRTLQVVVDTVLQPGSTSSNLVPGGGAPVPGPSGPGPVPPHLTEPLPTGDDGRPLNTSDDAARDYYFGGPGQYRPEDSTISIPQPSPADMYVGMPPTYTVKNPSYPVSSPTPQPASPFPGMTPVGIYNPPVTSPSPIGAQRPSGALFPVRVPGVPAPAGPGPVPPHLTEPLPQPKWNPLPPGAAPGGSYLPNPGARDLLLGAPAPGGGTHGPIRPTNPSQPVYTSPITRPPSKIEAESLLTWTPYPVEEPVIGLPGNPKPVSPTSPSPKPRPVSPIRLPGMLGIGVPDAGSIIKTGLEGLGIGLPPSGGNVPMMAVGGSVLSDGAAIIHKGETVVPADVKTPYGNGGGASGGGGTTIVLNNPVFQFTGKDEKQMFDNFMRRMKQEGGRLK